MRKLNESSRIKSAGVNFYLYDRGYSSRIKAQSDAVKLQKQGYRIRIVEYPDGWALYRRHGRKQPVK